MNSKHIILLTLTLLPVFTSALIAPAYFAPIRVPLYLVAVILALVMMAKNTYRFIRLPVGYSAIFFVLLFTSAAANSTAGSPVVYRQFLYHISVFFCIYIGYLAFRSAEKWDIDYPRTLNIIFAWLFLYGIYTYFAQVYQLREFLLFLRPSPAVREVDLESIFTQNFYGALNRYRAYSIWYEPSFTSLALACALPLLFFSKGRKIAIFYLFISGIYTWLTYSRSAWLVYLIFILIYFWSNSKTRLPAWLLSLLLVISIPLYTYSGFFAAIGEADLSALIRFYNTAQGVAELTIAPWAFIIGLGSPELIYPPTFDLGSSSHITNAFVGILHWLGVLGLAFLVLPFIVLINKAQYCEPRVYWAVFSFVFLVSAALNLGGNFISLSLLWFFFGVYYAIAERNARVKKLSL